MGQGCALRCARKEEQLVKKLIDIWKNKDFVLGIINSLKTDEESTLTTGCFLMEKE